MIASSWSSLFADSDSPLVTCMWLQAEKGTLVMCAWQHDIDNEEWVIPLLDFQDIKHGLEQIQSRIALKNM